MNCSLCDQDKPLIQAHIYPRFLYKGLKLFSSEGKSKGRVTLGKIKDYIVYKQPKGYLVGIYDETILCECCDNFINRNFENYAKDLIFPENKSNDICEGNPSNRNLIYSSVDYTKLKLFFLSIFWRASISSRDEFSHFKLDISVESSLKAMIKNCDAKTENDFPLTFFYLNTNCFALRTMSDFKTFSTYGVDTFAFRIGGLLVYFNIQSKDIPLGLGKYMLKQDGTLNIMNIIDQNQIAFLLNKFS